MRRGAFLSVVAIMLMGAFGVGATRPSGVMAQPHPFAAAVVIGACESPGEAVSQLRELAPQNDGGAEVRTSFSTIDQALTELAGGGYAIVVSDGPVVLACGEIPGGSGADVFLGLKEQGGSGYQGIAWLHARETQTQVSLFVGNNLGGGGGGNDGPPLPPDEPTAEPTPEGPLPPEEPTATPPGPGPDEPTAVPTAEPPLFPTPTPGGGGNKTGLYQSPSFGYRLAYDAAIWSKEEEFSEPLSDGSGNWDYASFWNGFAFVEFIGVTAEAGFTANDCVTWWRRNFSQNEGVTGLKQRVDDAGQPVAGGNTSRAFAVYDYVSTSSGEPVDRTFRIDCYTLPGQNAILGVLSQADRRVYDGQAAAIEDLQAGLTIQ